MAQSRPAPARVAAETVCATEGSAARANATHSARLRVGLEAEEARLDRARIPG